MSLTATRDRDRPTAAGALDEALDALLRFGAAMLRAGNTAYGVREWMGALGLEELSVTLTLDGLIVGARRGAERATMVREIGPPGVNSSRIAALEALAREARPGVAPPDIAAKIAAIEAEPARYGAGAIAAAVGLTSGAFALINGGGPLEAATAGLGGGVGQWVRARLARAGLNQHGVAALSALVAAGVYALIAALPSYAGFDVAPYPAGFISSILFLVPGFPLLAALLDLLQHQTVAAVTRFANGAMLFLAAAFGLSVVIAIVGFDVAPQPPFELSYPVKLLLRAVASFVGGYGFAMLFNSSPRAALAIGLLALGANELRLGLKDAGMGLAGASFFGALALGLLAALVHRRLAVPRITITVPGIIIMVPGIPAFQAIVLFAQARMLEALEAASLCAFATGALGIGLAVARFLTERWRSADDHKR